MSAIFGDGDEGGILIATLMVYIIVSIMAVSLLNSGLMEYKSSQFEKRAQQAQQGADAAIEWGMESVYAELNQPFNLICEELPVQLTCGDAGLVIGQQGCQAAVGSVTKVGETVGELGQCSYEFIASATFDGARRQVKVEVGLSFSGGYETVDQEGNRVFLPRVYKDRGRVITYQYYYS
ncbi:MAG: hypothetical protein PHG75_05365 [Syntrophomonas sp.]|jgi:Tfp pilus assembly protein PilX|nr:hypothetical protein [Syntrophomonas sp.]